MTPTKTPNAKSVTEMNEVVCQLCDTRVKQTTLEFHLNMQHLKVFPYRCKSCGFRAATADLIETHKAERGHSYGTDKNSYLADLSTLISSACVAVQNVGMSTVLQIFDNNLASGGSFPTRALFNTENFKVPTRTKAESKPTRIQIQWGTEVNPILIEPDIIPGGTAEELITNKPVVLLKETQNGQVMIQSDMIPFERTEEVKTQHRLIVSSQKQKFPCGQCPLIFSLLFHLQQHIKRKHNRTE